MEEPRTDMNISECEIENRKMQYEIVRHIFGSEIKSWGLAALEK
jgi:hypothetical protein